MEILTEIEPGVPLFAVHNPSGYFLHHQATFYDAGLEFLAEYKEQSPLMLNPDYAGHAGLCQSRSAQRPSTSC